MPPLLKIQNVTKKFGGLTALSDLSFSVDEKVVQGLIGPNGSGKTTLFNCITGFLKPDKGDVYFKGHRITGVKTHKIARMGIGRTFQLTKVFKNMTVLENLLVASTHGLEKQTFERAYDILEFVNLDHLKNENAKNLSFGEQKLLELAKVLMLDPELILLDEPTAGLNPLLVRKVIDYIRKLCERGKTIIVIEHNIRMISDVSGKVIVLDHGAKIAEGPPKEITQNRKVIEAYLGVL